MVESKSEIRSQERSMLNAAAIKARDRRRHDSPEIELCAPRGLDVSTFEVGSDEYAVFEFPLPRIDLPPGLTRSEQDVVRGVLDGLSNAEIAKARGTSPNTVANQLRGVYEKLGVSGRGELIRYCVDCGNRAEQS